MLKPLATPMEHHQRIEKLAASRPPTISMVNAGKRQLTELREVVQGDEAPDYSPAEDGGTNAANTATATTATDSLRIVQQPTTPGAPPGDFSGSSPRLDQHGVKEKRSELFSSRRPKHRKGSRGNTTYHLGLTVMVRISRIDGK